ncbi:hypothetical protein PAXINDRAFT_90795, partial [Paxillus involutus ATCC 200175]
HWFRPLQSFDNRSRMFRLTRSSRNRGPHAVVVPIDRILRPCHLIPQWGDEATSREIDDIDSFLLNPYIDLDLFDMLADR